MRAADLMVRDFKVIHPDAAITEILAGLRSAEVDPLPVCENGRLLGLVRHQDLDPATATRASRTWRARVRDVMTPDLVYCFESTEVAEAAALMRENEVRCLPVLDRSG